MITLKAARVLHVETGAIEEPGLVTVDGDRITGGAGGAGRAGEGEVLDLGDVTLLPGLMDMEVNLLMGGRGETAVLSPVQDDPPLRMLRAVGNARRTLRSGFTTVRNLGLFVKTGGYLLDVALAKAIDSQAGSTVRASSLRATPSRRPAGIWTPRCSPPTHPGSCPSPLRRASPTASTRCARPSGTRSSTAHN